MKSHLTILSLLMFGLIFNCQAANDLALISAKIDVYEYEYSKYPLSQAQNMTFKVGYNNIASFNHSGVFVNLVIINSSNDTVYNEESTPQIVPSGSVDDGYLTTPFFAPAVDQYTLIYTMYQDSLDVDSTNNLIIQTLDVVPNTFQLDNGVYSGPNSVSATANSYEIGNYFEVYSPCSITSASVVVDPSTVPGAEIFFSIYDFNQNVVRTTDTYIIDSDDFGDTITLYFSSPVVVFTWDTYIVTVTSYNYKHLKVQMAQSAPSYSSYYINEFSNWFLSSVTPMVRINVDMFQNTVENSKSLDWEVFPNPTTDNLTIAFDDFNSQSIVISDLLGKVVLSKEVNNGEVIDVSDFSAGTYIVVLNGEASKLIVNK
jgi:hypothetical protein